MARFERLYSGVFECADCEAHFEVEDWPEDDLYCEDCGGDLLPVEDNPDTGEDAEDLVEVA